MKRFILTGVAALIATIGFAQQKGDMYVSGAFNISGGQNVTSLSAADQTIKSETPSSFSFDVAPAFYYFVIDNLAVGARVGYSLDKWYQGVSDDVKLFQRTNEFYISPGVIYYVPLSDKFFYTPAFGLSVGFGNVAEDVDPNTVDKQSLLSFGLSLNVLAFEFKPTEHIGISVSAGDFAYSLTRTKASGTVASVTATSVTAQHRAGFDLNLGATFGFKYYF